MFGLHMDRPPAANFDLKGWKLDTLAMPTGMESATS